MRRVGSCVAALLLLAGGGMHRAGENAVSPALSASNTSSQPRDRDLRLRRRRHDDHPEPRDVGARPGAGDELIELPASPAAQTSRYGEQPYAMVLEGHEALFMKSGQEPLSCTR